MNKTLTRITGLFLFIIAVTFLWAAVSIAFPWAIVNLVLGIIGIYVFFRSLDCIDIVNGWGKYADENQTPQEMYNTPTRPGRTRMDSPISNDEDDYHQGTYNTRALSDDDDDSPMDDIEDASDTDIMDSFLPDDETM